MSSPFTWSFSTCAMAQCPCSIWQGAAPSGAVDVADTSPVTAGLRVPAASDATITGVRFCKETDNTGTHADRAGLEARPAGATGAEGIGSARSRPCRRGRRGDYQGSQTRSQCCNDSISPVAR